MKMTSEGSLQKENRSPLEASLDHLLKTPPSHFSPQKVRGWVGRFFVNEEKSTTRMVTALKILSS
jgi:hypothetical protein